MLRGSRRGKSRDQAAVLVVAVKGKGFWSYIRLENEIESLTDSEKLEQKVRSQEDDKEDLRPPKCMLSLSRQREVLYAEGEK